MPDIAKILSKEWFSSISTNTFLILGSVLFNVISSQGKNSQGGKSLSPNGQVSDRAGNEQCLAKEKAAELLRRP
jgi:hypothetical protein